MLHDLRQVVARASPEERQEAERYDEISRLIQAVSSADAGHRSQHGELTATHADLTGREKSLVAAVADLERPESNAERKARQFRKILFLVIGLLILGLGVLLNVTGDRMLPDVGLEIIMFVLGGIALFISWRNSDSSRAGTLASQQRKLSDVRQELATLTQRRTRHDDDVIHSFRTLHEELKALGGDSQASPGDFSALLAGARQLETSWLKAHPEVKTVL